MIQRLLLLSFSLKDISLRESIYMSFSGQEELEDEERRRRDKSRSVSPFVKKQRSRCVLVRGFLGGGGGESFRVIPLHPPPKGPSINDVRILDPLPPCQCPTIQPTSTMRDHS